MMFLAQSSFSRQGFPQFCFLKTYLQFDCVLVQQQQQTVLTADSDGNKDKVVTFLTYMHTYIHNNTYLQKYIYNIYIHK